jgi:hypothetical protein
MSSVSVAGEVSSVGAGASSNATSSVMRRSELRGDHECVLGGFLSEVGVTEEADQADEDTTSRVAEDLLEDASFP